MGDSLSHLDDLLSVVHANQINNIFDWSFSLLYIYIYIYIYTYIYNNIMN